MNVDALLSLMAGSPPSGIALPSMADAGFGDALEQALGQAQGGAPPPDLPPPWPLAEGERGESETQGPNAQSQEMDPIAAQAALLAQPLRGRETTGVGQSSSLGTQGLTAEASTAASPVTQDDIQIVAGEAKTFPVEAPAENAEVAELALNPLDRGGLLNTEPLVATDLPAAELAAEAIEQPLPEQEASAPEAPEAKPEPTPQNPRQGNSEERGTQNQNPHNNDQDRRERLQAIAADRAELTQAQRQGVRVELDVRDLGFLTLDIEQAGGAVSAKFSTENEQVRQALVAAQPHLTKALDDKGLVIKDFSVSAGFSDANQHQPNRERFETPRSFPFSADFATTAKSATTGFIRNSAGLDLSA